MDAAFKAVYILNALCYGSVELSGFHLALLVAEALYMCSALSLFGPAVLLCLLSVMSEVDDSTPLLQCEESSDSLVIQARDCLEPVRERLDNDSIAPKLLDCSSILFQTNSSPNQVYAVLSALSVRFFQTSDPLTSESVAVNLLDVILAIATSFSAVVSALLL
jgi:hypothetical protein